MNWILYMAMAAGAAALIGTAILIYKAPKPEKGLYEFKETGSNLFLALLCLVSGYFVIIARLMDPSIGGAGDAGLYLCAAAGLILILMACWLCMIAMIKKTVVYKDEVITVSSFGKKKTRAWQDLIRIEKPALTKASRFVFTDGTTFTVQAISKAYKPFMDFARSKMKGRKGKELIHQAMESMQQA